MALLNDLPKTQKAIIFNPKTNHLSFSTSTPLPDLSSRPNEHLIRIHTTAITNGELTWSPFVNWPTHHIPTYDITGTILTPIPNSPFTPEDEIYGRIEASREGGAAEYATILPSETALRPKGLSVEEAATVPMSALTAWQGIFEQAGERLLPPVLDEKGEVGVPEGNRGKRVLVLAAAGGVGIFAVQFAKLAGAYVVGTASGRNEGFVRGLGADEVVDYTKTTLEEWVGNGKEKFDVVLDGAGGKSMLDAWSAIKPNGAFVSIVPGFQEPEGGKPEGVKAGFFIMESRGAQLSEIGRLLEKGLVRTWVDSVWRLEEWVKAFQKTATGHARGKVVLRVRE